MRHSYQTNSSSAKISVEHFGQLPQEVHLLQITHRARSAEIQTPKTKVHLLAGGTLSANGSKELPAELLRGQVITRLGKELK